MAAGTGASQRDVGGEFGARRQVQRWISSCENGGQWPQAVAPTQRDLGREVEAGRRRGDGISASDKGEPWQWASAPLSERSEA